MSRSPGEHVKLVIKDEWSKNVHGVKGESYVPPSFPSPGGKMEGELMSTSGISLIASKGLAKLSKC